MPKLLSAMVAGIVAAGVLAGSAPAVTISGTVSTADPTQTNRVFRDTVASSCGTTKFYPGTVSGGTFHYDAYTITNATATAQCYTVTFTASGSPAILFVVAYCPTFDPANIATNYAADPGESPIPGATTVTFSFSVAAGATCQIVVSEVTEGGCGATGCDYRLDITNAPLAATFRSVAAVATADGALVRWSTASEQQTLGFNVYRSVNATRVKVNRSLIAARNSVRGGAYSFLDRSAPRARPLRYWIQVVNLDGSRSWYGPARVVRP